MLSELGGSSSALKITLVGSYAPRRCGIATFTQHLASGLAKCTARMPFVAAINDCGRSYAYGPEVVHQLNQQAQGEYLQLAGQINADGTDVVCLQHEFGIFGGAYGDHVLRFLSALKKPVATTFHTILAEPEPDQLRIIKAIGQYSSKLIVMTRRGAQLLQSVYDIAASKIQVIPHGVPELYEPLHERPKANRTKTLLTFGLISPDKGIENVIQAMPKIIESNPEARYIVVGATHPHILAHSGESYRDSLIKLARELGISNQVLFLNRFVSERELMIFLHQADIYVTPYLKIEQITSGTLAYAVGSGKAIISTPYWHAEELLADGCGVLVPCRDPEAIASAANELFANKEYRNEIESRAKQAGSTMSWSAVAKTYHDTLSEIAQPAPKTIVAAAGVQALPASEHYVPCLDHLKAFTDDLGLYQHAVYTIPRYEEGYCTDDNTRALLLMALLERSAGSNRGEIHRLAARYLAFLNHAYNRERMAFRNMLSYSRFWLEEVGSEDSQGRAAMGLGCFAARTQESHLCSLATDLFELGLARAHEWTSPRAWAYAILGMDAMRGAGKLSKSATELGIQFSDRLNRIYCQSASHDWPWFEHSVTYCNARLPQAHLLAATWRDDHERREAALAALDWLWNEQLHPKGYFSPIGSDEPYVKGQAKPEFDQQPVEAASMVSACLTAYQQTQELIWHKRAQIALDWFFGANHLGVLVYSPRNGGCYDGLHQSRLNMNQGAESTVSCLTAMEEMRAVGNVRLTPEIVELAQFRDAANA